ncbi:rossmann fold nucleotide-binding protein [Streptomyces laurentii]|uniref:Rossmann fold nucleotide-binding protein n=1 Tax=Streptomyces laurentii TaxID=39478 RepID=A0A160P6M4_STRLU|nr:rossmann fold nucleotide-binding protein [Streptomyces laurentii]
MGIPTWFYGREPPNAFASQVAKYFANAIREDGLPARSTAGVVFLPGAAGTVQEIFDDATPNERKIRARRRAGPGQNPRRWMSSCVRGVGRP